MRLPHLLVGLIATSHIITFPLAAPIDADVEHIAEPSIHNFVSLFNSTSLDDFDAALTALTAAEASTPRPSTVNEPPNPWQDASNEYNMTILQFLEPTKSQIRPIIIDFLYQLQNVLTNARTEARRRQPGLPLEQLIWPEPRLAYQTTSGVGFMLGSHPLDRLLMYRDVDNAAILLVRWVYAFQADERIHGAVMELYKPRDGPKIANGLFYIV